MSIAILTGAGISTGAGIPDFRGANGLWVIHPELRNLFDYREFMSKPKVRRAAWAWMHDDAGMGDRAPTAAHHMLAGMQHDGLIGGLMTQNIDMLHERAGSTDVIHLHGSMGLSHCQRCGAEYESSAVLAGLVNEPDPHCHHWNAKKGKECGGVIKMDVIYFGESLNKRAWERAHDAMLACDEFWALGTSLTVYPVADLMKDAIAFGKRTVIMNATATPFDDGATTVIHDDVERGLRRLLS